MKKAGPKRRTKMPTPITTEQRLLDAAGELFAEQGFRGTNVRDICRRAGANIAAVNYHFGDKQGLYAAVFKYAGDCARDAVQANLELDEAAGPEERLHIFIRSLLGHFFDRSRPAWQAKLMAREMIEPTRLLDTLIEENIRPFHTGLETIIRKLLGNGADETVVIRCAFSVEGQCVFYRHSWPVISRLHPELKYGPVDIERLADHITGFSLAGLKEIRKPGKRCRR